MLFSLEMRLIENFCSANAVLSRFIELTWVSSSTAANIFVYEHLSLI